MTVTAQQLITRTREAADMDADGEDFLTDVQVLGHINNVKGELHDLLDNTFEDWFLTRTDLSLTGSAYDLGADRFRGVFRLQDGFEHPIERLSVEDLGRRHNRSFCNTSYTLEGTTLRFRPENKAPGDVRLYYVSSHVPLTTGSNLPVQYSKNGWDEFIVVGAAIHALEKEDDVEKMASLGARKAALTVRITKAASTRDATGYTRCSLGSVQDDWYDNIPEMR